MRIIKIMLTLWLSFINMSQHVSYMLGVTFYPIEFNCNVEPSVYTRDPPQEWPKHYDWLYQCLPCLIVQPNKNKYTYPQINPESAARLYDNIRFNKQGNPTHFSPALIRFLALVYSRVEFESEANVDVQRYYTTRKAPKRLKPERPIQFKYTKHKFKQANDWRCTSVSHIRTYTDDEHPDSVFALGHRVCRTCYKNTYGVRGSRWHSSYELELFLHAKFVKRVFTPLYDKPLGFILQGIVYSNNSISCCSDLILYAHQVNVCPPLWALDAPIVRGLLKSWFSVVSVVDYAIIKAINSYNAIPGTNGLRHKIVPHINELLTYGRFWIKGPIESRKDGKDKQSTTERFSLPNKKYILGPLFSVSKKRNARVTTIGRDVLFSAIKDTPYGVHYYTRACALVLQRLRYNDPPITVKIQLCAPKCTTDNDPMSVDPRRVTIFTGRHDTISLFPCEYLTWGNLYYALDRTKCHTITLTGNYTMCKAGISSSLHPYITGSTFVELVDMAFYQHTTPFPVQTNACVSKFEHRRPFAPFVLEPLGPLHIVKSPESILHEIAKLERESWINEESQSSWPPNTETLQIPCAYKEIRAPSTIDWGCFPQPNADANGTLVD